MGGGRTEVSTSAGGRGAQLLVVDTSGAQLLVDTSGASWSLLRLPPTSGLALALHSPRTAFRSCNSSYLRPAWLATACLVVPFKLSAVSIQLEQTTDALFFSEPKSFFSPWAENQFQTKTLRAVAGSVQQTFVATPSSRLTWPKPEDNDITKTNKLTIMISSTLMNPKNSRLAFGYSRVTWNRDTVIELLSSNPFNYLRKVID